MSYSTQNLRWIELSPQLAEAEQKILLALSSDKWEWRTKDRLLAVTGLSREELESSLAGLIRRGLVRPSFSRSRNLIYGLVERVGS